MTILGIESSADETSAAVVRDGTQMLSNVVASSLDLHQAYGGIVPEIAARSHLESVTPAIQQALDDAKCGWGNIDAIAVTQGPGLIGSLLIGILTARTLAIVKGKPLYGINHVQAHVYANFITSAGPFLPASGRSSKARKNSLDDTALIAPLLGHSSNPTASSATRDRLVSSQSPANVTSWELNNLTYTLPSTAPEFPLLALIVSGGHTQLVLFENHQKYRLLGQTADDAVGEAYDKVAKMLGLPYPGGPSVDAAARGGNTTAVKLPRAAMTNPYDFSFSGLKTAVLRAAQQMVGKDFTLPSHELPKLLNKAQVADLAASFQDTAVKTLVDAAKHAADQFKPKSIVIAGGVAANQELRRQLEAALPGQVTSPDIKLCTDNAAMIASQAFWHAKHQNPSDPYTLEPLPNFTM